MHPWVLVKEKLNNLWMTSEEFLIIIDKPKSKFSQLLNWNIRMTPEWAVTISAWFNVLWDWDIDDSLSASNLLALQNSIDLDLVDKPELEEKLRLYNDYPIKNLISRKLLEKKWNLVENFKNFMNVSTFEELDKKLNIWAMYRKTNFDSSKKNIAIRLYLASIKTQKLNKDLWVFNELKLFELAKKANTYTNEIWWRNLATNIKKYIWLLNEVWVKVLFFKHFENTRIDWAVFLDGEAKIPTIVLSARYKRLDNFWFTLLHEIWHIIYDRDILEHKAIVEWVEFDWDKIYNVDREERANNFAKDCLIDKENWKANRFNLYNKQSIEKFSFENLVNPSIVVWRLKHEKIIPRNKLTRMVERIDITMLNEYSVEELIINT